MHAFLGENGGGGGGARGQCFRRQPTETEFRSGIPFLGCETLMIRSLYSKKEGNFGSLVNFKQNSLIW